LRFRFNPFRPNLCRALWRRAVLIAALLAALLSAQGAVAAELLMYETAGCPWCQRWKSEIGATYPKTPEGQRAPLRVVAMRGVVPAQAPLGEPVRYSPTFVLIDEGREIGRITGYIGEDQFWGLLGVLMKKLDAPHPATGKNAGDKKDKD
jgi:hypothetical protein